MYSPCYFLRSPTYPRNATIFYAVGSATLNNVWTLSPSCCSSEPTSPVGKMCDTVTSAICYPFTQKFEIRRNYHSDVSSLKSTPSLRSHSIKAYLEGCGKSVTTIIGIGIKAISHSIEDGFQSY